MEQWSLGSIMEGSEQSESMQDDPAESAVRSIRRSTGVQSIRDMSVDVHCQGSYTGIQIQHTTVNSESSILSVLYPIRYPFSIRLSGYPFNPSVTRIQPDSFQSALPPGFLSVQKRKRNISVCLYPSVRSILSVLSVLSVPVRLCIPAEYYITEYYTEYYTPYRGLSSSVLNSV